MPPRDGSTDNDNMYLRVPNRRPTEESVQVTITAPTEEWAALVITAMTFGGNMGNIMRDNLHAIMLKIAVANEEATRPTEKSSFDEM